FSFERNGLERDVLAVVEPQAVAFERERRPAEPRAGLVERHLGAGVRELDRGGEPGQAPADDARPHASNPSDKGIRLAAPTDARAKPAGPDSGDKRRLTSRLRRASARGRAPSPRDGARDGR